MDTQQNIPDILQVEKDFIKPIENRKSFDEVSQFFKPQKLSLQHKSKSHWRKYIFYAFWWKRSY